MTRVSVSATSTRFLRPFNHNTKHAAFGGNTQRRMCTILTKKTTAFKQSQGACAILIYCKLIVD